MDEQDLQQLNNESETEQPVEIAEAVEPADNGEAVAEKGARSRKVARIIDIVLWVLIAVLAAALVVRMFVLTQIVVDGESMTSDYYDRASSAYYNPELTFHDEDVVKVSKLKKPQRGDVVIFYENDGINKFFDIFSATKTNTDDKYKKLIKRVVALAGDKIWVEKVEGTDNLYRVLIETPDGETLREDSYVKNGETLAEEAFYVKNVEFSGLGLLKEHVGKANALTISENCFFAMGDNRSNSSDSRTFGEVPLSRLYGVVRN